MDELGLRATWDSDDRRECQEAARHAFQRLKQRYGGSSTPVEEIPGFLDSLECLLRDGFGLTDVAVMFGVSRERVRQWVTVHQLERRTDHGSNFRLWDNDKNRFVPVPNEVINHIAGCLHERRLKEEAALREAEARQEHVDAVKRLAKRFGRTPTQKELGDEIGIQWPQIARSWGYDPDSSAEEASYASAYRRLCDAARVPPRNQGGSGHVT